MIRTKKVMIQSGSVKSMKSKTLFKDSIAKRSFIPYSLSLSISLALVACTPLTPKYERPSLPVVNSYQTKKNTEADNSQPSNAAQAGTAQKLSLKALIKDDQLKKIIDLALQNNRDLRVAALQVQRAQAQYQVSGADLFPKINASLGNTATKTPANLAVSGQVTILHDYTSGLGFSSYELDMFGRLQSLKAAAFEQYLSVSQAERTVKLSLVAQVATQYFTLMAERAHLETAQQTLSAQQKTYDMDHKRFELGVISELDLSQSRSLIESSKVELSKYKTLVAQDTNLLNQLVGTAVTEDLLKGDFFQQKDMDRLPVGLPSDLMINRPDILDAEHQLIAANANIGAARAAYFPSITLTSFYGSASPSLNGLFGSGSRSWLFVPQVNLPIFDGGRISANLKIAESNQKIAISQYEKTIQTAFREVADALAVDDNVQEELRAQEALVSATQQSLNLSLARYEQGISSYLNVLDSERAYYSARQNYITIKLLSYANTLTLYKALGGGV